MISNFFSSMEEENLWIELNAHEQIEWEKSLVDSFGNPTLQARNHRSLEAAIQVAKNQLKYDTQHDCLRSTIDQYIQKGKSDFAKSLKRDKKLKDILS